MLQDPREEEDIKVKSEEQIKLKKGSKKEKWTFLKYIHMAFFQKLDNVIFAKISYIAHLRHL